MALFWIILGALMLTSSVSKKQRYIVIFFSIVLILLLGFRSVEMEKNDTEAYFEWFGYDSDLLFLQFEPFYAYLNIFVYELGLPYELIQLVMASITIGFLVLAFKKENTNLLFSLSLYYFLCYYFRSYNIMRQMAAISIVLYAYSCLRHKQTLKYILLTLLAALIHTTSLLTFVAFFFRKEKTSFNKLFVIITLIVTFILGALNAFQPIIASLGSILPRYLVGEATRTETFSLSKLAMNVFFIFLYFNTNTKSIYTKLYFMGICLINIITFHVDMMRISYFFLIAEVMVLSEVVKCRRLSTNGQYMPIVTLAYSIFIFSYLVLWGDMSGVLEYELVNFLHYK